MDPFREFAVKSKKIFASEFIIALLLALLSATFFIAFSFFKNVLFVISASLIAGLFIYVLIDFIFYLTTPNLLIEINDEFLKINKRKNDSVLISLDEIDSSRILDSSISIFSHTDGAISIKPKQGDEVKVKYLSEFIEVNGKINSIKLIKIIESKNVK